MSVEQLRVALEPFGNAAQIVGTRRVELYDLVRQLAAAHTYSYADSLIRQDDPTFGPQNEAGEAASEDFMTVGRNDLRWEQRQRNSALCGRASL